ncbi:D-sedoheptulose 7-phosphate isomerase [Acidomonas methanolica]|uniref:Phosphoheptose isomerase n=1 Tax=Acidomonas methanolica NBRC 104435 TaxID=1231351 RepID=A0A023D476_ACIMT|nr:D-sedoheptulose 7-phosphate isomerase [Acidomonas methanolica]TCS28296.1 phosphoheptose isomerase [Acidomonas methanolica]GAJ28570.1 phosphoheptose isomerase [Acidomonas methanolica NBRC 104435]GBQ53058.1 phosphoheptose isomerase [Acidomonas methanolica]GEK99013.1 phosphoheptose isomerase [Acidomonas methanolica NBRC 104435]
MPFAASPLDAVPLHMDLDGDRAFMRDYLDKSAAAMSAFASDRRLAAQLLELGGLIADSLAAGGKLLTAGNGGSAGDAQHIASEFTARLMYDRRPLAAVALTTDSSSLTAISNDYGYEHVFARQVLALGRPGDVFLGISTSGRSPNILRAFTEARRAGLTTIAFCGSATTDLPDVDHVFSASSDWTPVIQQVHITAGHIVCGIVERRLCPR